MKRYQDISGRSGVDSYEARSTSILVRFKHNRDVYLYDHSVPGKKVVDEMKWRAISGEGLATYISQVVRDRYAKKLQVFRRYYLAPIATAFPLLQRVFLT